MIKATELRLYNIIGCKVSNDSGIYQVEGIDGWKRIFKSKEDENKYHKNKYSLSLKDKPVEFHDERLIRLSGGARNNEQYIESQLRGIKLTEEWLLKLGFVGKDDDGTFYHIEEILFQIQYLYLKEKKFVHIWDGAFTEAPVKYIHQLQNIFFALTGKELNQK